MSTKALDGVVAAAQQYPMRTVLATQLEANVLAYLRTKGLKDIAALALTIVVVEGMFHPTASLKTLRGLLDACVDKLKPVGEACVKYVRRPKHVLHVKSSGLPPNFRTNTAYQSIMWYLEHLQTAEEVQHSDGQSGEYAVKGGGDGAKVEAGEAVHKPGVQTTVLSAAGGGSCSGSLAKPSLWKRVVGLLPRPFACTEVYATLDMDVKATQDADELVAGMRYTPPLVAAMTNTVTWRGVYKITFVREHKTETVNNGEKPMVRDVVCVTLTCEDNILKAFNDEAIRMYLARLKAISHKPQLFKVQRTAGGALTLVTTPLKNRVSLSNIAMDDRERKVLMTRLELFKDNEEWYHSNSMRYKLSVMSYGPPGTGKTMLGKAIAAYLGLSYADFNLSMFKSDLELDDIRAKLPDNVMLAFDDLDAQNSNFTQRTVVTNVQKHAQNRKRGKNNAGEKTEAAPGVSLARMLSLLDGDAKNGQVVYVSTNYPDVLDEAMLRSQRVDALIAMMPCTAASVKFLFQRFFPGRTLADTDLPDLEKFPSIIPADVESVLVQNKSDPETAASLLRVLTPRTVMYAELERYRRINPRELSKASAEYVEALKPVESLPDDGDDAESVEDGVDESSGAAADGAAAGTVDEEAQAATGAGACAGGGLLSYKISAATLKQ